MRNTALLTFASLVVVMISTTFAYAYVGPGAGLSALGSLLSLFAAIGLGIVGFIWYPIRRLLRRGQSRKQTSGKVSE